MEHRFDVSLTWLYGNGLRKIVRTAALLNLSESERVVVSGIDLLAFAMRRRQSDRASSPNALLLARASTDDLSCVQINQFCLNLAGPYYCRKWLILKDLSAWLSSWIHAHNFHIFSHLQTRVWTLTGRLTVSQNLVSFSCSNSSIRVRQQRKWSWPSQLSFINDKLELTIDFRKHHIVCGRHQLTKHYWLAPWQSRCWDFWTIDDVRMEEVTLFYRVGRKSASTAKPLMNTACSIVYLNAAEIDQVVKGSFKILPNHEHSVLSMKSIKLVRTDSLIPTSRSARIAFWRNHQSPSFTYPPLALIYAVKL